MGSKRLVRWRPHACGTCFSSCELTKPTAPIAVAPHRVTRGFALGDVDRAGTHDADRAGTLGDVDGRPERDDAAHAARRGERLKGGNGARYSHRGGTNDDARRRAPQSRATPSWPARVGCARPRSALCRATTGGTK